MSRCSLSYQRVSWESQPANQTGYFQGQKAGRDLISPSFLSLKAKLANCRWLASWWRDNFYTNGVQRLRLALAGLHDRIDILHLRRHPLSEIIIHNSLSCQYCLNLALLGWHSERLVD